MLDASGREELLDDGFDGVDRDREADAGCRGGDCGLGGVELRADPDHLAAGVDQRPAGVAVVDRGVGLDRVRVGGAAAELVDAVLEGADDSDAGGAAERRGVADRDDGVADLHLVGVAEREGAQRARVRGDLEDGHVGGGVLADDGGLELVVPGEADANAARAGDDAVAGEDVAGLVDHEPGAEPAGRG